MKNVRIKYLFISLTLLLGLNEVFAQSIDLLSQTPISNKPEIFAPGVISTGMYERDIAITPNGDEIYYSLFQGDWNTIMVAKRVAGIWQEPEVAPFARDTMFFFAEPALTVDGEKIFFLSTKPRANEKAEPGWTNQNIWFAKRKLDGSWDVAQPLPDYINEFEEFYPSLTKEETLYFCRTDEKTKTSQILRSKLINGVFQNPTILPAPINQKGTIFNACIAPDDSFLIGCVTERDSSNMNRATYMLFFHNADDTWSDGIDLVKMLNLPCPNAISVSISPDGKILYFASTNKSIRFKDLLPDWKIRSISKRRLSPGNGNSDIYRVKIEDGFKALKK